MRAFQRLKRSRAEPLASLAYPRLALYRQILRTHERLLPADARALGNAYVKAEFELHRDASANFAVQFERQWRDYLITLRASNPDDAASIGREMSDDEIAALSDEQKVQLLKIREQAAGPPSLDSQQ